MTGIRGEESQFQVHSSITLIIVLKQSQSLPTSHFLFLRIALQELTLSKYPEFQPRKFLDDSVCTEVNPGKWLTWLLAYIRELRREKQWHLWEGVSKEGGEIL